METIGIVVVDDEEGIRESIASFLVRAFNCQVEVFGDGETAWQSIKDHGAFMDLIHIIITDHEMPKATGMELIRAVRRNFPEIKIIMLSGAEGIEEMAMETGANIFLKKPFKLKQIQEAVQRLIS